MHCPIVFWSGIRYPCRRRSEGDASGDTHSGCRSKESSVCLFGRRASGSWQRYRAGTSSNKSSTRGNRACGRADEPACGIFARSFLRYARAAAVLAQPPTPATAGSTVVTQTPPVPPPNVMCWALSWMPRRRALLSRPARRRSSPRAHWRQSTDGRSRRSSSASPCFRSQQSVRDLHHVRRRGWFAAEGSVP